jgi:uncharacterized membrane protein
MGRLRKLLTSLALVGAVVVLPAVPAYADVNDFTVTDFSADYTLSTADKQGELHVVERIDVDFTDSNHGVLRALPKTYKNQSLDLHINSVTSSSGAPSSYTTYDQNGNTVLRIGDPNRTVTGAQEYTIDYTMQNVMTFYTDHDELYWDVNGDQWQQPFTHVAATLHLPPGLDLSKYGAKCFAGSYGSQTGDCSTQLVDNSTVKFETAHALTSYQTLTLVAGFPKGSFAPASFFERFRDKLGPALEFSIPVLVALVGGFVWWLKVGRDAKGRGVIVPAYSPPDGISPLEAGTITDFNVDNRDITATIIDLARRGYMKIIETRKDRLVLKDSLSYSLQLEKNDYTELNAYEQAIMGALFPINTVGQVLELTKNVSTLYKTAEDLDKDIPKNLAGQGYFRQDPHKFALKWGSIFAVVYIGAAFLGPFAGVHAGWLVAGLVLGSVIFLLFLRIIPARTAKGTAAKEQLLGLKMYMEVAEKDRLEKLEGPNARYAANAGAPVRTVELFEKLLPYAIVMGVEKEWATQFNDLYTSPPSWYSGNFTAFNAGYLVGSLSTGFSPVVNSSFSAPRSSGSSGFGGGGFSGGGGGGGGGGGW